MTHVAQASDRCLRAGIVVGGTGALIGAVHRIAAELDHEARVVAGAMSSDPDTARDSAVSTVPMTRTRRWPSRRR